MRVFIISQRLCNIESCRIGQSRKGQSAVGFQLRHAAGKADLAAQLPQALVGLRRRQQLQSSPDGLCDTSPAGLLGLSSSETGISTVILPPLSISSSITPIPP